MQFVHGYFILNWFIYCLLFLYGFDHNIICYIGLRNDLPVPLLFRFSYSRFVIPSRINREGDIVLMLYICPSEFRFSAISLQLLARIQRNLMGTINTKSRYANRRLVLVIPFNTELWPLISNAVCIYSKTIAWNLHIPLPCLDQTFSKDVWPKISYAV
jgi:hypothetical protein